MRTCSRSPTGWRGRRGGRDVRAAVEVGDLPGRRAGFGPAGGVLPACRRPWRRSDAGVVVGGGDWSRSTGPVSTSLTRRTTRALGRPGQQGRAGGVPQVRLVALAECGTMPCSTPWSDGQQPRRSSLPSGDRASAAGMLLLADRGFYGSRCRSRPRASGGPVVADEIRPAARPDRGLPDGSFLSQGTSPQLRTTRRGHHGASDRLHHRRRPLQRHQPPADHDDARPTR